MYNNKLQYSWSDYDKDIKSIEWLSFDRVIVFEEVLHGCLTYQTNIVYHVNSRITN